LGVSKVGSAYDPIIMKSTLTENAFMYRLSADLGSFGSAYGNWNNQTNAAATFSTNHWYFLAATFDGAKVRYYLNGTPLDSAAFAYTMTADSRALTIGADVPGVLEIFNGKIDDVRLYNRALSPGEVMSLYTQSTGVPDPHAPV